MLDAKVISLDAAKKIAAAAEAEARKQGWTLAIGVVDVVVGAGGVTSEQDAIVAPAGAGAIR